MIWMEKAKKQQHEIESKSTWTILTEFNGCAITVMYHKIIERHAKFLMISDQAQAIVINEDLAILPSLFLFLSVYLSFALARLNEYDKNLHGQRWFLFGCSWSNNDFGQFICRLAWFPCLRLRRNSSLRLFLEVICRLNFFTFNRARHRDIIKSSISCCACYKFECPRVNGNLL